MAGIIRRQDLTLSEFLELYRDHEEHASLYETKFDTNLITYRHSISTVWAFEKLRPQARKLLELISFLDPDVIKEDLLMEASMELLSEGGQFKKSHFIEARTDLLRSSLVQRDKQQQHISVHRIVQDAILASMSAAKKRFIFNQVVQILWEDWPSAMPKPSKEPKLPQPKSTGGRLHVGRWPVCATIYPHILRIHQIWSAISDPSDAIRLLFAKLLNEAAWFVITMQSCSFLYSLTGLGIKKNVGEQGTLMAFLRLLSISVRHPHMQIGTLCLRTFTSLWEPSLWMRAISIPAASIRNALST
jgi:hypothetical protein